MLPQLGELCLRVHALKVAGRASFSDRVGTGIILSNMRGRIIVVKDQSKLMENPSF